MVRGPEGAVVQQAPCHATFGAQEPYSERAMLRSGFVRSQQRIEHLKMPKKEIYVLKITKKGNKNKIFT